MMLKRICLIGGEDVHKRIPLSKQLIHAGFEVTIIGTSDKIFPSNITYYNYNLVRHFSPISDYKTIKWLQNYFSDNQFDIIHTFDTKPAFLVPLALKKINTPITRTITGLGTIFMSNTLSNIVLRKCYSILHKSIKSRVYITVFQNKDDLKLYLKNGLVSKSKTKLIYSSGIDLNSFKERATRNQNPFTFICVARLVYEKGIINFLEAAKICKSKGLNFKYVLVGPLEENSKRLNKSILEHYSDDVDILGSRSDVKELLLKSDAFVLPTFREGFSRVLLEAAALGLPIISTHVTGVRDFVSHKKEALLTPPKNSKALSDAMIQLVNDKELAEQLVENALKKVKAYSIDEISKQYIAIFDNAINQE
mgnify:CR=1 FL=1